MTKKQSGSGYSYLKDKYPDVRRWYENLSRGSDVTADVYLRRLGNYCESKNITPIELTDKNEKQLYNDFLDLVSEREKEGKSGAYISSIIKALKSWLLFNDIVITKKIKIRNSDFKPTLKNERIPTLEELRAILVSGDKKTRVSCILMAHSGLRPEVIGNYRGDDGLRISDLPELVITEKDIEFEKIPTKIVVRSELSKCKKEYITFLSEEGCLYLKDYLEERLRSKNGLTKDSAIIAPSYGKKEFITSINISHSIRRVIRKAGLPWRPYVLRSFFASQLMLAESHNRSLRDYRTFWMGHKGDIEHEYTTNNRQISPQIIENMRDAYTRSQEFFLTNQNLKEEDLNFAFRKNILDSFNLSIKDYSDEDIATLSEEEFKKIFNQNLSSNILSQIGPLMLEMSGISADSISKEKLTDLSTEEFTKFIRESISKKNNNEQKEKIVSINEVAEYLKNGWCFVTELSNGKVIIRRLD
jgi:site-specific recombinase XerD